jgi:putative flippase GtrA
MCPKSRDLRQTSPNRALVALRRLRTHSGLVGQGARFAIAGVVVTIVYLSLTTFFALALGLPFQAALALGFCLALAVHFTLQRLFVWVDHGEFALPLRHQAGRYLLLAGAQYGITAASTSLLPSALGLPTEVIYLATVAFTVSTNFLVFRNRVFHATPAAVAPPRHRQ